METVTIHELMFAAPCRKQGVCSNGAGCRHAVVQNPATGRWFVTAGHGGFNSRANNGSGFESEAKALHAVSLSDRRRKVA